MSKLPLDDSIIHVKVPFELHVSVKVRAMQAGVSMNQYVSDRLREATETLKSGTLTPGNVTELDSNTIYHIDATKGTSVTTIIPQSTSVREVVNQTINEGEKMLRDTKKALELGNAPVCKIHGQLLDARGRCLQKGCKYA